MMSIVYLFMASSFVMEVSSLNFVNVALHKPTRQVHTFPQAVSGLAVDGNKNTDFFQGSCSHTKSDGNKWWAVDLITSYPVHSVEITNRIGDLHLRDFFVYVSEKNPVATPLESVAVKPGKLCFSFEDLFNFEQPKVVECEEVITGRYLYFWKPGDTNKICLCEVEVLVEDTYVNSTKEKTFTASILHDWKSPIAPFRSIIFNFRSPVECVSYCLSAEGGVATLVQMNKDTGVCECIEKSNFKDGNPATIARDKWLLMESTKN